METMERCSNQDCLAIKRGKSKVRACVALRKPLLLMPPRAPTLALPTAFLDHPAPEPAPMLEMLPVAPSKSECWFIDLLGAQYPWGTVGGMGGVITCF